MIFLDVLAHDLHRSREGVVASPLVLETPAKPSFLPAVVSNSRGGFVVCRHITRPGQVLIHHGLDPNRNVTALGGGILSGVFPHDSEKLDDLLTPMFSIALRLSFDEGWSNVSPSVSKAFDHVRSRSGLKSQPRMLLVPSSWTDSAVKKRLGSKNFDGQSYRGVSRVVPARVELPVFCSRPDMVGMYTQFLGGQSSVILHNVEHGLGFCPEP